VNRSKENREASNSDLAVLRRQWQEAISDDSEGLDPDQVFDVLEKKYKMQAAFDALDAAKLPEAFMCEMDRDRRPPANRASLDELFQEDDSKG